VTPLASSSPRVSVIVPVHNGARRLPALLAALERQTAPRHDFELLVIDDCSTDATAELVAHREIATLLRASRRGGPYPARNQGMAAARGEYLAFTDADCVPADEWIQAGISALDSGAGDLIAGHIDVPLSDRPTAAAMVDCSRYLDQERHVADGFGATANLWVRRTAAEQIGPFNARLRSGGDTEYGLRARRLGLVLSYGPTVTVTHEPRGTGGEMARKEFRLGYGIAQQRRHSELLSDRAQRWRDPGAYLPKKGIAGFSRLERRGVRPSLRQMIVLHLVQYFFADLPLTLGNLAGTVEGAVGTGRTLRTGG
jgi:glycosyltransferase involved in cell wall biosynthesis